MAQFTASIDTSEATAAIASLKAEIEAADAALTRFLDRVERLKGDNNVLAKGPVNGGSGGPIKLVK